MEPPRFKSEVERLRDLGWTCRWHQQPSNLPPEILARYEWLPEDYLDFVSGLAECSSPEENRWILAPSDFDIQDQHAFSHDEWERLGLDSAGDDPALISAIREFWNGHIPICFDVSDGYSFHAIRVVGRSGNVVTGREPEFEEVELAASDFTRFLANLK